MDYPELWEELFQNALAGSAAHSNIVADAVVMRAERIANKAYPRVLEYRRKWQDEAMARYKEEHK